MGNGTPRYRASVLGLVAVILAGCSSNHPQPRFLDKTTISVGMHNDLPGVSYLSNTYVRSGTDYLLEQRIDAELGITSISPTEISSADRVPRLVAGKVDMVIGSFSITADRMKDIDFVGPYLTTRQGFLVGPGGANVRLLSDLNGQRVCTWAGTTSGDALAQLNSAHVDVVTQASAAECLTELKAGRVFAFSTDQTILYGFEDVNAAAALRVVPDLTIGAPQHYGIGIPKGHRRDCERLKQIVKHYVESSTWIADIEVSLPRIPAHDRDWVSHYKPSAAAIDARSCRDRAGS
ncbi:transporter substrate-binding domain-containing protein [Embleya scabrispora]|uniref:transporter substrate-binding domain-containing protein n=1 Tax=Embleya scabrispora TaxID=159449 RepID=UPI0003A8DF43|nr:transporter substrate-binding domain-containing protein [Embleya scabrispora]MYS80520.1 transporter substrate-binding domain-containing protein [Streptomyces sp. SID5474]